jgi:chromosome condensin MukBEF ATPase and DNA-binding subunit MukB
VERAANRRQLERAQVSLCEKKNRLKEPNVPRQAANESRLAALTAAKKGSDKASSSQYAPYTAPEARAARQQELLRATKRELAKHPNIILTAKGSLESDSEDSAEEEDDAEAAMAWVRAQMEKEKRKRKSNANAPPTPSRSKLDRDRQGQQSVLGRDEDNMYKVRAADFRSVLRHFDEFLHLEHGAHGRWPGHWTLQCQKL